MKLTEAQPQLVHMLQAMLVVQAHIDYDPDSTEPQNKALRNLAEQLGTLQDTIMYLKHIK